MVRGLLCVLAVAGAPFFLLLPSRRLLSPFPAVWLAASFVRIRVSFRHRVPFSSSFSRVSRYLCPRPARAASDSRLCAASFSFLFADRVCGDDSREQRQ